MRLIDADALIDGYKHMGYDPSEHPEESYMEGWCKGFNSAVDHCIHHVIHAPTIEPECPKGEWIPVDSYSAFGGDEATWMAHDNPVAFYYCSECKEQAYAGEDGESLTTEFCPSCGADMRGEQDE